MYLQNTEVAVVVNNAMTSMNAAEDYNIPIPAVIPSNMTVAVLPSSNSEDKFWLAMVTDLRVEHPLTYNLRYYQYNKSKKGWFLMKGNGGYGWVPHSAIIAAGIEFNANKSLKATSIRLITKKLQQI
jgi:hypothetical protein